MDTPASQAETRALLARFRRLQALLRGEEYVALDDPLARDVEAQKRGEIPAFIARKLAAEKAGTARVLKEQPGASDKAKRMATDQAAMRPGRRRRL